MPRAIALRRLSGAAARQGRPSLDYQDDTFSILTAILAGTTLPASVHYAMGGIGVDVSGGRLLMQPETELRLGRKVGGAAPMAASDPNYLLFPSAVRSAVMVADASVACGSSVAHGRFELYHGQTRLRETTWDPVNGYNSTAAIPFAPMAASGSGTFNTTTFSVASSTTLLGLNGRQGLYSEGYGVSQNTAFRRAVSSTSATTVVSPVTGTAFSGYTSGGQTKWRLFNVGPEGFDTTGGWVWLDRARMKWYYTAPLTTTGDGVLWVSTLSTPFLSVSADDFQATGGAIYGGHSDCVQVGATSGFSAIGMKIKGPRGCGIRFTSDASRNGTVDYCNITDCGRSPLHVRGGNRKTRVDSGHLLTRNYLQGFRTHGHETDKVDENTGSTWAGENQAGGLVWGGHGHVARYNTIAPCFDKQFYAQAFYTSHGINLDGRFNESGASGCTFEYNTLLGGVSVARDMGAVYAGRDITQQGNTFRYNLIDGCGIEGYDGSVGVYMDDLCSGWTIYGNLFVNYRGHGGFNGGGNNLWLFNWFDSPSAAGVTVYVDNRGDWHGPIKGIGGHTPPQALGDLSADAVDPNGLVYDRYQTPIGSDPTIKADWLSAYPLLANVTLYDGVTALTGYGALTEFRYDDNVSSPGTPVPPEWSIYGTGGPSKNGFLTHDRNSVSGDSPVGEPPGGANLG